MNEKVGKFRRWLSSRPSLLVPRSSSMTRIRVMHITDTLEAGGAERVALNLANLLPRERYLPYLCTTRRDGPLADLVAHDVGRLRLERRQRFELGAVWRLIAFIRTHKIQILHAHETSLFIAYIASLFPPFPRIIWHDHFGRYATEERPAWLYRLVIGRVSAIIAVNQPLVEWARNKLRVPPHQVSYIPNFVCRSTSEGDPARLPGTTGSRVVCVANLRPQKDHITLLRAMALVARQVPTAHLLLVGASSDLAYLEFIRKEISQHKLDHNVSLLGERRDVYAILRACDIGVLSSASEGLPLALLEYGMAGLPSIATSVGQCAEVLDGGRVGILVPPGSHEKLAEALLFLLHALDRRLSLGGLLRRRIEEVYSAGPIMERVCQIYETVLRA